MGGEPASDGRINLLGLRVPLSSLIAMAVTIPALFIANDIANYLMKRRRYLHDECIECGRRSGRGMDDAPVAARDWAGMSRTAARWTRRTIRRGAARVLDRVGPFDRAVVYALLFWERSDAPCSHCARGLACRDPSLEAATG